MMSKNEKSDFTLVISWGGSKGIYACWILKALEELNLKKKIKAIYGVSAGALTGAYWLSWRKAEEIFQRFLESELFSLKNIAIPPKKSLLKTEAIEKILRSDLKKKFNQLEAPLLIGATDLWKGKFILFETGDLIKPLMGSIAVPGMFEPIEYEKSLLVDGGVTNNFPIELAKKNHPDTKIIGILLGKFKKNQKVSNMIDVLLISYNILLKAKLNPTLDKADILFYRELWTGMVENNNKKLTELFELGYKDGISSFSWWK